MKKVQRQNLRRFDLILPAEHPIWNIPPGQRSAMARRWLDMGMEAENYMANLDKRLEMLQEALLSVERVDKRLGVLQEAVLKIEREMEEMWTILDSAAAGEKLGNAGESISKPKSNMRLPEVREYSKRIGKIDIRGSKKEKR